MLGEHRVRACCMLFAALQHGWRGNGFVGMFLLYLIMHRKHSAAAGTSNSCTAGRQALLGNVDRLGEVVHTVPGGVL